MEEKEKLVGDIPVERIVAVMRKGWPAFYDLVLEECEIIEKINKVKYAEVPVLEVGESEMMIARVILPDYGKKEARKIGKLLVDATE